MFWFGGVQNLGSLNRQIIGCTSVRRYAGFEIASPFPFCSVAGPYEPFEDVFPIEKGDFLLVILVFREGKPWWIYTLPLLHQRRLDPALLTGALDLSRTPRLRWYRRGVGAAVTSLKLLETKIQLHLSLKIYILSYPNMASAKVLTCAILMSI